MLNAWAIADTVKWCWPGWTSPVMWNWLLAGDPHVDGVSTSAIVPSGTPIVTREQGLPPRRPMPVEDALADPVSVKVAGSFVTSKEKRNSESALPNGAS